VIALLRRPTGASLKTIVQAKVGPLTEQEAEEERVFDDRAAQHSAEIGHAPARYEVYLLAGRNMI
jgi:hypothetical protein